MKGPRRFMDLLNWGALIAPGVILGKDGSCLAGWRMRGLDTESMEPDVFESWMATLALRLSEFGDDHVLWVVFHRRALQPVPDLEPTGQQALDVLAIEMNELLAAPGTLWADELTLFFSWTPEVEMAPEEKPAAFADECALLETRLDHILGLTRLDRTEEDGGLRSELCAHLSALAGTPRPAPRIDPDTLPVGLDALFPDCVQERLSGPLRVSGRPLACLTIEGLRETYPLAPLAALQDVPMPFAWVTRFAAMSPQTARASALWNRKLWHQSGADMIGNITGHAGGRPKLYEASMAASADQTVAVATRGDEGFGTFVPVLLVYGDPGQPHDALAPRLRILREALGAGTLSLREERANAVPAFLSALPGHVAPNPRARMTRARVMADFMPVRGIDRGRSACPSALMPKHSPALLPARARTGEMFHFNLHVGDVGHTLMFGPTGGGKSVLLGLIASAWLRYPDARVIFFDRHRSVRHACNALGGTFLEPGTGEEQGLAPMAHVHDLGAPWAVDWLCELVRQGTGTRPNPEQAEELGRAALALMRTPEPGLRQVQEYVQDATLRQCLEEWLTGPLAGTFDRDGIDLDAGLDGARLTVFETAALLDAREAVTVLSLDYIFAQVARRFERTPHPRHPRRGLELSRPRHLRRANPLLAERGPQDECGGPDGNPVDLGCGELRHDHRSARRLSNPDLPAQPAGADLRAGAALSRPATRSRADRPHRGGPAKKRTLPHAGGHKTAHQLRARSRRPLDPRPDQPDRKPARRGGGQNPSRLLEGGPYP